jgi:hypothetical protein
VRFAYDDPVGHGTSPDALIQGPEAPVGGAATHTPSSPHTDPAGPTHMSALVVQGTGASVVALTGQDSFALRFVALQLAVPLTGVGTTEQVNPTW